MLSQKDKSLIKEEKKFCEDVIKETKKHYFLNKFRAAQSKAMAEGVFKEIKKLEEKIEKYRKDKETGKKLDKNDDPKTLKILEEKYKSYLAEMNKHYRAMELAWEDISYLTEYSKEIA